MASAFLPSNSPTLLVKNNPSSTGTSHRITPQFAKSKGKNKDDTKAKVTNNNNINNSDRSIPNNINNSTKTFIRFSHCFQRHVVFNSSIYHECCDSQGSCCTMPNPHHCQVLESFRFFDDAMIAYPCAKIVPLNDVALWQDEEEHDFILGGMGSSSSRAMMRSPNHATLTQTENEGDGSKKSPNTSKPNDIITVDNEGTTLNKSVPGIESLHYLATLALSGQGRNSAPPRNTRKMKNMHRNAYVGELAKIAQSRFASHTPDSIRLNYNHAMDLFTRCRNRNVGSSGGTMASNDSNLMFEMTRAGLSLTQSEARALIAEFPQICLYERHDLVERIKFMISPLSPIVQQEDIYSFFRSGKYVDLDYFKMMTDGFGAGLTIDQATEVIKAIPQFLSIMYEDAQKPHMLYFYQTFQISSQSIDEARTELSMYMTGSDVSDICAFELLHSLGVRWNQIRMLLDAFPTLTCCDTDPGWELLDHGNIRSKLKVKTLIYLRKRLQITNSDIHAMMKTHSRLSSYGIKNNLMPTMDALEKRLGLTSMELRRLVLRMPSILGMGVDSNLKQSALDKRIDFFLNEAQLSPLELKKSILKQPALLQYSVENSLRPKLDFLLKEVEVPSDAISRVIKSAPAIMGLSLDSNLRPTISLLKRRCDFSSGQVGLLIANSPIILTLSLKKKINPCLTLLSEMLSIKDGRQLGELIECTPRILFQGLESSLCHKFDLLVDSLIQESENGGNILPTTQSESIAASIIRNNPSLLATTNAILQSRIEKCLASSSALKEVLKPSGTGRKKIFSNDINSLHRKKSRKDDINPLLQSDGLNPPLVISTVENTPSNNWMHSLAIEPFKLYQKKTSKVSIIAFVSASTFPSENISSVRGRRKAGGIALHLPQKRHDNRIETEIFALATKQSFGTIMPEGIDGSSGKNGLILTGFPFLRPSRNRCDLYACHGALKLVLQLLKIAAAQRDMDNVDVDIDICSDSSYSWKILNDSDQVLRWGAAPSIEAFKYDGFGPKALANPDLLYPLAKTMSRVVNSDVNNKQGERICLGNNIRIQFRYSGEVLSDSSYLENLNECTRRAARWQFNRAF